MGIRRAGEDEEEIGESVQVPERNRVDRVHGGGDQRLALGPAADRPGDVQPCRGLRARRQDEALELGEIGVEAVAVTLERVLLPLGDAQACLALERHREVGAEVEELVLNPLEGLAYLGGALRGEHEADHGIELVDGPVRSDPRIELGDACAIPERRLPLVATAGVDLGQPDGLVALTGHTRRLGGVLVRPVRTSETDTIADVFIASFRGLAYLPKLHTDDEIRTWITTEVVPRHEVWIAEVEGRLVGFAALSDDLLGHLYVHPDGQDRGAGTALFDVVKRERPEGFRLWVFQRNEGARRFYERHGCRLVELTDGGGNMEKEPDALYEWVP